MGPTYYLNEEILGFRLDEMSSTHYVNNTVKIRFIVSSKGPFLGMIRPLRFFIMVLSLHHKFPHKSSPNEKAVCPHYNVKFIIGHILKS